MLIGTYMSVHIYTLKLHLQVYVHVNLFGRWDYCLRLLPNQSTQNHSSAPVMSFSVSSGPAAAFSFLFFSFLFFYIDPKKSAHVSAVFVGGASGETAC